MEKKMIQFEAGDGVNYLISEDRKIYAEVQLPDEGPYTEDFGYITMVKALKDSGADLSEYKFWYDGQEHMLAPDAAAEAEVYIEVNEDE